MSQEVPQPEVQLPEQPIVFYPQSDMDGNIQYKLVYQPVYISEQDSKMYIAGPILQELPITQKGFLQSLQETWQIGTKKVSDAVSPVGQKIQSTVQPAARKVGDSLKHAAEVTAEKFEGLKNKRQNSKKLQEPGPTTPLNPEPM